MGQTGTDHCDRWLDGSPDEDRSHDPSHVDSVRKPRQIMNSNYTGNTHTANGVARVAAFKTNDRAYKIPTAILPQIANFIRTFICR